MNSAHHLDICRQRYTMPDEVSKGLLTDIGTEELAHLEIVGSLVAQLSKNVSA